METDVKNYEENTMKILKKSGAGLLRECAEKYIAELQAILTSKAQLRRIDRFFFLMISRKFLLNP